MFNLIGQVAAAVVGACVAVRVKNSLDLARPGVAIDQDGNVTEFPDGRSRLWVLRHLVGLERSPVFVATSNRLLDEATAAQFRRDLEQALADRRIDTIRELEAAGVRKPADA